MVTPAWILDPGAQEIHDAAGCLLRLEDKRLNTDDGLAGVQLAAAAPALVAALVNLRKAVAYALGDSPENPQAMLAMALRESAPSLAMALGHVPEARGTGREEAWPWA